MRDKGDIDVRGIEAEGRRDSKGRPHGTAMRGLSQTSAISSQVVRTSLSISARLGIAAEVPGRET
ncbi:hypothetical protein LY39_03287 [Roseinatronobacter bogoriensis subsp. barguzinensis]|nr:hypothetical protein [Rhodobaca bogoriensis DSM 18756]TDW35192.1 hypothetical protein LY39_03287 [Rhodobaca barguzinensis]TDY66798.1 hypothetical protein EV660_10922 [Rhodobaca bogoriensis DSM 18756]